MPARLEDDMKLIPNTEFLYVRSMGKLLRVTAIFNNDTDANKFMAKNDGQSVVACFGPYILLANVYDTGLQVN
jgi:hypothetical protein